MLLLSEIQITLMAGNSVTVMREHLPTGNTTAKMAEITACDYGRQSLKL